MINQSVIRPAGSDFERGDGFYPGLTDEEYDGLPAWRRSKVELIGVPPHDARADRLKFYLTHPQKPPTAAMRKGSIAHASVNAPDSPDFEALDRLYATPTEREWGLAMRTALLATPEIAALWPQIDDFEATVLWTCPDTDLGRKAKIDWLLTDSLTALDYKTIDNLGTDTIWRAICNGLHRQEATYMQGLNAAGLDIKSFGFVFQEKVHPFACRLVTIPSWKVEEGKRQVEAQMRLLDFCLATGEWPGPCSAGFKEINPRWWTNTDGGQQEKT